MTFDEHLTLDRSIAIEVFGEKWADTLRFVEQPEGWLCIGYEDSRDARRMNEFLPYYSASIGAAWQIISFHERAGRTLSLEYDVDYGVHHQHGWSLAIEGGHFSRFEDTPCLAICQAALKWAREVERSLS